MNVKELKELLNDVDDDTLIGFSNGYTYTLDLRVITEAVSNWDDNAKVFMLMTEEEFYRRKVKKYD